MESHPTHPHEVFTNGVLRASRLLGLTVAALACTLGLDETELSGMAQGFRHIDPESPEGLKAVQLVRVFCALEVLVGSDDEARIAWMHSHNQALGGSSYWHLSAGLRSISITPALA